jgi:acyl-CoA reductase-like NAD-dependent aldehyde dehydrogenase
LTESPLASIVGGRRRQGDEVVPDVNPAAPTAFEAPFGGMRASSSGSREQGKVAQDFFTQWKTVYLDAPPWE